ELRKLQRTVETRRKRLEKQIAARRRAFEKRAQKELDRLQKEWRQQPLVKRASALGSEARTRLGEGVASVVESLPIATRSEVERIERKLRSLDRKLREIEKARSSDTSAAA